MPPERRIVMHSSPGSFRLPLAVAASVLIAVLAGVLIGYARWGRQPDWFQPRDLAALPAGAESDRIRYGWALVVETPRHIGRHALDPARRYAGNDLACTDCHIGGGLKPFAAPFVSTYTSYPMMVDDRVLTLAERINGCMTRSMNGAPMPEDGPEMQALIAYMRFLGRDAPAGVRVAGMGLLPLKPPALPADAARGAAAYAKWCAGCHAADGQGDLRTPPAVGYAIPPLWGPGSFNAAAGMNQLVTAAAFIHANMPLEASYRAPVLSEQEAWDLAAYMTSRPRPGPRPPPTPAR
jgi:thiosulfate dehydrogenase